ncbi:hypothetical protein [Dactylosporangium sp. CA-233914]|uniref:hypothetical protein n=1 Tax=Dactylosporangium sp. CA-233914 TaxID=3239934 RepID=UPI003D8F48DE
MNVRIEFSGDDLARRVPLLGQFRDDLIGTLTPLTDIAACRWADGVDQDDEQTIQARNAVRGVLSQYILPSYVQLGDSVGVQGDKLDLVRKIGDNIESTNGEAVPDMHGGRHG